MRNPFKKEVRSEQVADETTLTDTLLRALIGQTEITKEMAMQIPAVKGSVELIKNVISSLKFNLYEKVNNKIILHEDDYRVALLNRDSKANLTGTQLKKAIVDNYLLEKGAYIYKEMLGSKIKALHFVEAKDISILHNSDPVIKTYQINVGGKSYFPYEFIKVLRNTTDGFTGHSLMDENPLMLAVAYDSLTYEHKLVKKGGNKRGFLKSDHVLGEKEVTTLKQSFNNLYTTSQNSDNVVVLNKGIEFQDAANTSVEMQLNENKITNTTQISMLFCLANAIITGNATEQAIKSFAKFCIAPLVADIECSLNRDFLLTKEQDKFYWSADISGIDRGSFKDMIEAYAQAIKSNIYQVDEVRAKENLQPLGFNFIQLGLDSVLYNPTTKTVYTPNTNQTQNIDAKQVKGGEESES